MKKLCFVFPVLVVFFFACNSGEPAAETTPVVKASEKPNPAHFSADSMEVIYFKDTANLRYFTLTRTTEVGRIAPVLHSLQDTLPKEIPCLKEGKIYLFEKGAVVNTLYFVSDRNQCNYISYIKNGELIRFNLSDSAETALRELKKYATEPEVVK